MIKYESKNIELKNGEVKFKIDVPLDAKCFRIIDTLDGVIRIYFKTKFGGKKYLDAYIELPKET